MKKQPIKLKFVSMILSASLVAMMIIPALPVQQVSAAPENMGAEKIGTRVVSGTTYYVSNGGDDNNDGKSEAKSWATLEKVNNQHFQPGDQILFKAGNVWNGSIKLREVSGTKVAPIIFDKYGSVDPDVRPIINGNGTTTTEVSAIVKNYTGVKDKTMSATIDVVDGSYLEFHNFELTNKNPNVVSQRAGINIRTASTTVQEWEANRHQGIVIKNNYVHDVDGNPTGWKVGSGGILILGNITDVLVEGNIVKHVDIEGIRNAGLYKEGDINANFPRVFEDIIFNNNYVEDTQGDAFVMSNVGKNGRMEYNTVVKHSSKNVGNVNYAGLWVIGVKDMIMQYNEVYGGVYGYNDGQAFDVDMFCEGTLYQYNYSHSNRGGFILFMGGSKNSLVRYNVSVNDGDGRYIFHYLPTSAGDAPLIHNNTFFTDSNINTKLISDPGKYLRFYNNIFYSKANTTLGQDRFAGGEVKNNIFYPGTGYQDAVLTGISLADNLFESPQFARAGEEPNDIINMANGMFDVEKLNGYKLLPGSPAIDAGLDMSTITPSVWPTADKDFFNNSLTDGKVDIGAHEYSNDAPINQSPEIMPKTITLDRTALDLYSKHVGTKLIATVGPEEAWFSTVKWSSSDPSVATVNMSGFITPMIEGVTTITAESTVDPTVKAVAHVTVHEPSPIVTYKVATDDTELSDANPSIELRIDGVTEDNIAMSHAPFYKVEYETDSKHVSVDSSTGKLEATGDLSGVKEIEISAKVQEYKELVYSESFESGWGDFIPETGISITTGRISDKVSYQGKQSALYEVGNGSNAIQKLFGASQQGVVTMMLYDDASKNGNTRVVAHVGNSRSSLLAGLGILYDGNVTYGSLDNYSVRASGASTSWIPTSVKRSKGWHELKWDYTSGTDLKMYIDGVLVHTTTVIKDFDRIVLGYLWDSANGRTFAFDNIKFSKTNELMTKSVDSIKIPVNFVDKESLRNANLLAQSIYDAAVAGTEPGQYPEGSMTVLNDAIIVAQTVLNKLKVTQTELDAAVVALNAAVEVFEASVNKDPDAPVNTEKLSNAISVAQAVYDNAVEGTDAGQYPEGAKIQLELAIDEARVILGSDEITQTEIDAAVVALNAAVALFTSIVIPDLTTPTWSNGLLSASNVGTSRLTLNWSGTVNTTDVTEYKVYKDGLTLGTVTGSVYSYEVTGLNSDTLYAFKVEAGNGNSKWSTDGPDVAQRTIVEMTTPGGGGSTDGGSDPIKSPDGGKDGEVTAPGNTGTEGDNNGSTPHVTLTDVNGHWASSAIQQAVKLGFIKGYSDNTFRPNAKVTRAEFATMLGRALKLEGKESVSFADLDIIPAWARTFVAGIVDAGIVNGYNDNTFRPTQDITRVEIAVMIVRALDLPLDSNVDFTFEDADKIPAWAKPYVAAAVKAKLLQGRDTNEFAPTDRATRAEAVTLILALLNNEQ
ncbi:S-layer homology domain-containing protein [Paenibacillus sp. FA6]|uniref:S-layer homology domain-containing protein n=1 Tax=Paenibacillus sp. FA6 TaxID=3413029 RepID=UPI003F657BE8